MHVSSLVFAYAVSPGEDLVYGASFHRVYEASTPAVIGIAVDLESDTYALSIKPKLPARVLFHKSTPFTFVNVAVLIAPPKADMIDDVNEINTLPEPLKVIYLLFFINEIRKFNFFCSTNKDPKIKTWDSLTVFKPLAKMSGPIYPSPCLVPCLKTEFSPPSWRF